MNGAGLINQLLQSAKAIKRAKAMQHRIEASQRRTAATDWKAGRRQRTRHLIELGGLVKKAGLVELAGDDRAVLLGAFLRLAEILSGENAENTIALCRRRGRRAFADAGELSPDDHAATTVS
jgi:hypothetical protein